MEPSTGPSALPICFGNANVWNAGYGSCSTYASRNHNYCSMDITGGLYAREVCPECLQCSSPALVQRGHGLRRAERVWKQRGEVDGNMEAKIKVAAMKKQKATNFESIAKRTVMADRKGREQSGETVLIQAAKSG